MNFRTEEYTTAIQSLQKKYGILPSNPEKLSNANDIKDYIKQLQSENIKLYGSTIVISVIIILVLILLVISGYHSIILLPIIIPIYMASFSIQKIKMQRYLIEELKTLTSGTNAQGNKLT